MATKAQLAVQKETRDYLRETLKPGDTVSTILRHVSRSGMLRAISVVVVGDDGDICDLDYQVARALGYKADELHGGIKMTGCGMDMGFALVYQLSHVLFPDGFDCIGDAELYRHRCPSNDHSNGGRDYAPSNHHRDGGYALRHRWV